MKISGIISFIVKLIVALALIFITMGMPVVLKLSTVLLTFGGVSIVLAIIEFILALKNKAMAFGITNIVTIVVSGILLFISRSVSTSDYQLHKQLYNENDLAYKIFFLLLAIQIILGIVNIILGFTSKKEI